MDDATKLVSEKRSNAEAKLRRLRQLLASVFVVLLGLLFISFGLEGVLLIMTSRAHPPLPADKALANQLPFFLGCLAVPGGVVLLVKGAGKIVRLCQSRRT